MGGMFDYLAAKPSFSDELSGAIGGITSMNAENDRKNKLHDIIRFHPNANPYELALLMAQEGILPQDQQPAMFKTGADIGQTSMEATAHANADQTDWDKAVMANIMAQKNLQLNTQKATNILGAALVPPASTGDPKQTELYDMVMGNAGIGNAPAPTDRPKRGNPKPTSKPRPGAVRPVINPSTGKPYTAAELAAFKNGG